MQAVRGWRNAAIQATSVVTEMTVTVLAFARIRELLGFSQRVFTLPDGALVEALWEALAADFPALAGLRAATRVARNGELVDGAAMLTQGDEIAFLPPVSGG